MAHAVSSITRAYEKTAPDERPLGGYLTLFGVYSSAVVAAVAFIRSFRRPQAVTAADIALGAAATYRLSRLITKDTVTAFVRAPFTEFGEAIGEGEVNENARGTGLQHAIGELLTCPFCVSQWVATAYVAGLTIAPRFTRAAASVLAVVAGADALEFGYAGLRRLDQRA
ncbi:MAG TPA: DUF1360 domain-containing protein [Acidimicrobiales bacterium]|nr:DUF1360 domain-containing protein [Acidimicrobiales bacterium]